MSYVWLDFFNPDAVMTSMLKLFFSFSLLVFSLLAVAQVPNQYVTQENGLPCLNKKFSLRVHVNDAAEGPHIFETVEFRRMVRNANEAFAPICISFEDCEYLSVENYRYGSHENRDSTEQINQYGDPNRIDVFITALDSLPTRCGNATTFGVREEPNAYIMIVGTCIGVDSSELTHQLGHYFGLYHTYETKFGPELANGDNCETTGDLICDTPADPFVENSSTVYTDRTNPCLFVFSGRDARGQFYTPHVANAMSMYSSECGCGFTNDQLARMAAICQAAPGGIW